VGNLIHKSSIIPPGATVKTENLRPGPALAGAGPNARLRRGAFLSRALRRHRAQSTVLRSNWENGLLDEYQKHDERLELNCMEMISQSILFIWSGLGIANVSLNYVHVYD